MVAEHKKRVGRQLGNFRTLHDLTQKWVSRGFESRKLTRKLKVQNGDKK